MKNSCMLSKRPINNNVSFKNTSQICQNLFCNKRRKKIFCPVIKKGEKRPKSNETDVFRIENQSEKTYFRRISYKQKKFAITICDTHNNEVYLMASHWDKNTKKWEWIFSTPTFKIAAFFFFLQSYQYFRLKNFCSPEKMQVLVHRMSEVAKKSEFQVLWIVFHHLIYRTHRCYVKIPWNSTLHFSFL